MLVLCLADRDDHSKDRVSFVNAAGESCIFIAMPCALAASCFFFDELLD